MSISVVVMLGYVPCNMESARLGREMKRWSSPSERCFILCRILNYEEDNINGFRIEKYISSEMHGKNGPQF